jgi:hypothetical protein
MGTNFQAGDLGRWRRRRCGYRKRQRDTSILYEVGLSVALKDRKAGADLNATAMTASQMRIAETIDAFYGESGAKDGVSRSYKQAVEDLDAETIKALDGPYRTTVLEPISRFCAYFPDVNECTFPTPSLLTALPEPPYSNPPFAPQVSRSAATNSSTTTPCVPRSRSWSKSPTRT